MSEAEFRKTEALIQMICAAITEAMRKEYRKRDATEVLANIVRLLSLELSREIQIHSLEKLKTLLGELETLCSEKP